LTALKVVKEIFFPMLSISRTTLHCLKVPKLHSHIFLIPAARALPCCFVHHKLTRICSRSNKVFCGQEPPKSRHGLPDALHSINVASAVMFRRINAVFSENHTEHFTHCIAPQNSVRFHVTASDTYSHSWDLNS
jgi:hypothetical protein